MKYQCKCRCVITGDVPGSLHRLLNRYADAYARANNAPVKTPYFGRLKQLPAGKRLPLSCKQGEISITPGENPPHVIAFLT